jgi:hypothetical protein
MWNDGWRIGDNDKKDGGMLRWMEMGWTRGDDSYANIFILL